MRIHPYLRWFFPMVKVIKRLYYVDQSAGNGQWAETPLLSAPTRGWKAHSSPLNYKIDCLVFSLREGSATQAVVSSIVRAFVVKELRTRCETKDPMKNYGKWKMKAGSTRYEARCGGR